MTTAELSYYICTFLTLKLANINTGFFTKNGTKTVLLFYMIWFLNYVILL